MPLPSAPANSLPSPFSNLGVPTTLAQAIINLGLTEQQCIDQVKAHFASTDVQFLQKVADSIYATGNTGLGVLGVDGATFVGFAGAANGVVPVGAVINFANTWLPRLYNGTGANGDEITITRVDPAVLIAKNW